MIHRLIIHSLRDLQASCSCGKWRFTMPTFDRDRDDELRRWAWQEHRAHRRRMSVNHKQKG